MEGSGLGTISHVGNRSDRKGCFPGLFLSWSPLLPVALPPNPFQSLFCPFFHFLLIDLLKSHAIKLSNLNLIADFKFFSQDALNFNKPLNNNLQLLRIKGS